MFVAAHRSHTSDTSIPDNSLRAVEAAIAAGTDFIETDVWCTTDGVIVVNHDYDILCNDGEKVDIRKVKYERIKGTRLIDRHTGKFSENPADVLPTLEEFLNAGRGRVFYSLDKIEYNPSVSYIVKEVERLGMIESVYFYAGGNPQTITTILETNPHAHVGVWSGNIVPFRNYPDGIFYSQGDYLPSQGFDTNLHPDIAEGIFPWINYLGVHDEATTENSLNEGSPGCYPCRISVACLHSVRRARPDDTRFKETRSPLNIEYTIKNKDYAFIQKYMSVLTAVMLLFCVNACKDEDEGELAPWFRFTNSEWCSIPFVERSRLRCSRICHERIYQYQLGSHF